MKTAAIILGIFSVVMAGAFYVRHTSANKQSKALETENLRLSNECQQATLQLTDQKRVNIVLLTNLASRNDALSASSNSFGKIKLTLAEAEEAAKAARAEIEEREKRIADWEASHGDLAEKANEFKTSLGTRDHEIANVKKKLDASEGDRAFLFKELKQLQAERDDLAARFNDVEVVRAQLEKLRTEKVVNKRYSWANANLTRPENRGSELLTTTEEGPRASPNYALRVELQQDGSVRLAQPTGRAR
jgi:chromosome segregation ATPase